MSTESRRVTTAPAVVAQPKGEAWHSQSAEEVLGKLGSAAAGLSAMKQHAASRPNINLAIVVSVPFGLQVWSHHNAILGRFLKTESMSLADCFLLLAVGGIPLLMLEMVKVVRTNPE